MDPSGTTTRSRGPRVRQGVAGGRLAVGRLRGHPVQEGFLRVVTQTENCARVCLTFMSVLGTPEEPPRRSRRMRAKEGGTGARRA